MSSPTKTPVYGNFICAKVIISDDHLTQEKANDQLVLKALLGAGASWKVHVGEEKERPSEQWDSSAVARGLKVDENLRRLKIRENDGIETEKMADTGAEKEAEKSAAADWV